MTQCVEKGFNRLAPIYTFLSRLVFGSAILRSQEYFLHTIQPNDHVLILGGGSGELLQSLLKQKPHLAVDYIDISTRMLSLARHKTRHPENVNFITGTEHNIPDVKYSVVITNFYLDLFSSHTLQTVIQKIKSHLKPGAHWLVTDFVSETSWHKITLRVMYRFFRVTTGIEAVTLPQWQHLLRQAGFIELASKSFFGRFIRSSRYTCS